MSDIHIERNHSFDFLEARQKAKAWLDEAKREFGLDIDYIEGADKDTATIKKSGVSASATLDKDKVVFDAKLNFLAKPFQSMIATGIEDGLNRYFV